MTDPALAKALAAPRGGSYLAPFFERPCSAQEAVDCLDEPMSKVHHWVKRWLTLGALEIVERQPRAGRAITRYRTVADEFVVPVVRGEGRASTGWPSTS